MKKIKINELVDRFERDNEIKRLSIKTKDYYKQFITAFISWLPVRIKYSTQLTRELFEDYTLYVVRRLLNRASQNTYLRAVRRLYNFGAEIGVVELHPLKLPKAERKVKQTFTDTEARRIIMSRSIKKPDIIALVLLSTGIRSETLRSLSVSDYLKNECALRLSHLKNGQQTIIPLYGSVAKKLERYINVNMLNDSDLLFGNRNGEKYTRNGLYELMRDYCQRKGFKHWGVHIFRHTYAKYMAKAGCPSIMLARCLTHSTVTQSEHYVNLYGQDLRIACDRYNPVATLTKE